MTLPRTGKAKNLVLVYDYVDDVDDDDIKQ